MYRPWAVLVLGLATHLPRVVAQNHAFQWKFGNNFLDDSFQECQKLPIVVEPLTGADASAVGVPPYYLMAFELNGVPTTTSLGSDLNNLSWQVTHKAGSTLILTILDSNTTTTSAGSGVGTGGVSPITYNVTAGTDTSCLYTPPDVSTLPSIHPNFTDTLTTCQPWGLTIKGGKPPYTVVLAALTSPIITNVTMPAEDDVFTFIDRADPNGQLMASVVDASGQWGVSSSTIHTKGSTDVDCVGLVSSSKTTAEIQQESQAAVQAASDAAHQHTIHLILGLVLGLGIPAILGLALLLYFRYRPRKTANDQRGIWDDQDAQPRPWHASGEQTEMREVDAASQYASTPRTGKSGYAPDSPSATPFMQVTPIPPVYFDRELEATASGSGSRSSQGQSTPAMSVTESGRARKHREALQDRPQSAGSSSRGPQPASPRPIRMGTLPPPLLGAALDPEDQPDIIIQHRDGGSGVVQELPPPYVDRSAPPQAPAAGETRSP
ncbi:hypothetical protein PsYK624_097900 [Phanerochaete sordida]|uniref:Mid2 domain-containing protein n=1 Tax=Phanerochaete sordida TaxID=48140 RepID=A0A9P3GH76_9APHY|nr:hypothetical protein PsYK624_097900 [Phanerochaete sordida]